MSEVRCNEFKCNECRDTGTIYIPDGDCVSPEECSCNCSHALKKATWSATILISQIKKNIPSYDENDLLFIKTVAITYFLEGYDEFRKTL